MMEQVWSVFGGLDILVNKVLATFHDTTITGLQAADWDRTLVVCLKGPSCARSTRFL